MYPKFIHKRAVFELYNKFITELYANALFGPTKSSIGIDIHSYYDG